VWDALSLGRRDAVVGLLASIVQRASESEHEPAVNQWVYRKQLPVATLECLFCRKVLCELRCGRRHEDSWTRVVPWSAAAPEPHGEQCAAGVVAGLVRPRPPKRRHRITSLDGLAIDFEMSPKEGIADACVETVTIWGHGFKRAKQIAVHFEDAPAKIKRVVSDRELRIECPPADQGHFAKVWITLDGVTSLLRERFFYHSVSPY